MQMIFAMWLYPYALKYHSTPSHTMSTPYRKTNSLMAHFYFLQTMRGTEFRLTIPLFIYNLSRLVRI